MNVYDFDETIFMTNSLELFIKFVIKRHPKLFLCFAPRVIRAKKLYKNKKINKAKLLAIACSVVKYLKSPEQDAIKFWNRYEKLISKWYLEQKRSDDLIISASPEFLLKPLSKKLGIKIVGTKVDAETGVIIGNIRLAKGKANWVIGHDMPLIENFYSDSLSDFPLALLSENAYLVTDNATVIKLWPSLSKDILDNVHSELNDSTI